MLLLLACADPGTPDDPPADDTAPATDDSGTTPGIDCPAAADGLQDVTTTPAAPYYVIHPAAPSDATATILYLPGGDGSAQNAEGVSRRYLAGDGAEAFRLVIPYATGERDFHEHPDRAAEVRDEVLACWGGDPAAVHLGGTSNGGLGAFALFVTLGGEGFASLLGAPGAWESWDEDAVAAALGDKPLYMGVGELDPDWSAFMEPQAEALAARGADVTYVVFEGQQHVVSDEFDETVLFDFWRAAAP